MKLSITTFTLLLAAVLALPVSAADPLSQAARSWVEAFAQHNVEADDLETFLGHPINRLTKTDSDRLTSILTAVRRGENARTLLGLQPDRRPEAAAVSVIDTRSGALPLLAPKAAELATAVDHTEVDLVKLLDQVNADIARLPDDFPPDLEQEKIVVDDFITIVRTFSSLADDFEKRAPEILEAAVDHRNALRHAVDELRRGAQADRAETDPNFGELASAEDLIAQAYEPRIQWAEQTLDDLHTLLGRVKTVKKLLTRWEAVLQLMRPVVESGRLTQANRQQLLGYFKAVDEAMGAFKSFAKKVQASSEQPAETPTPAERR